MPHGGAGPLPLPHVEPPRPTRSCSRRVRQRYRKAAVAAEMTNKAISALNSLHTNHPSPTLWHSSNVNHFSSQSLRCVAHVRSCVDRHVSRLAPSSGPLSDGNTFLSTGNLADPLSAPYVSTTPALPLSASAVDLPSSGGFVQLLDVLPHDLASRYATFNPSLFRPMEERKRAPRACLVNSAKDYLTIIRRMAKLTMVTFTSTPKVVNGIFAAPKAKGRQRLVVDGRPTNAIWTPSPKVQLPTPDLLARLSVNHDDELFVAKVDLDNYYHRLRTPEWMWPYFALPPVRARDVGLLDDFGDIMVYPCCTTLPMGWSHAAFIGQMVHEHILDSRTSFGPEHRISACTDARVDRPRHHVYIDDFNMFGLCPTVLGRLQDEYIAVMESVGFTIKVSKVVRPSSAGVECVGMEINGQDLTCGLSAVKLQKLTRRTAALLQRRQASGVEMARLVGHWTWAFLARRPVFAVFNAVYRYVETAGCRVFQLWSGVERELRMAIALAPLLFSSLSARWFHRVLATDASEFGQGVVATQLSDRVVEGLARETPPVPTPAEPLSRTLDPRLANASWSTLVATPWLWQEHINVLETRALNTAIRWALSSPYSIGRRVLSFCDSLVVVHAARKGRSSSYTMLRALRQLTALCLGGGIQLYVNYIPTEVNPADGPSRRHTRHHCLPFDSTLGFPGEGPSRRGHFLFSAAFAPATSLKYCKAVSEFVDYLDDCGLDPQSVNDLDHCLVDYFHDMYVEKGGSCRGNADATLYGIEMLIPAVKKLLHGARLALRGWRRLRPPTPYPPLTWELAVAVGCRMARRSLLYGIGCLLAFDGYLRVGELVNLRREDVADSKDVRLGSGFRGMALRLSTTKTGSNQWAEVRDPAVCALLRKVLGATPAKGLLFPFSSSSFRYRFKAACRELGLSSAYVPHSLRHGGATRDFLAGVPLEEVLRRGRWATTKSARHYIQAGRAIMLTVRVPEHVAAAGRVLASDVLTSFYTLTQKH